MDHEWRRLIQKIQEEAAGKRRPDQREDERQQGGGVVINGNVSITINNTYERRRAGRNASPEVMRVLAHLGDELVIGPDQSVIVAVSKRVRKMIGADQNRSVSLKAAPVEEETPDTQQPPEKTQQSAAPDFPVWVGFQSQTDTLPILSPAPEIPTLCVEPPR